MKPLGLSGNALAKKLDVDPMRISQIIHGKRAITAETALLLAAIFETSARFWLGLQADHDLASSRRQISGIDPKNRPAPERYPRYLSLPRLRQTDSRKRSALCPTSQKGPCFT